MTTSRCPRTVAARSVLPLLALALAGACGGGGTAPAVPPPAVVPTVVAVSAPLDPAAPGAFTVTGSDLPGVPGDAVTVRLRAADGLPLAACDASELVLPGSLVSSTEVGASLPAFVLLRSTPAFVTLDLPGGVTATSTLPVAALVGAPDPARDQDEDGVPDPCDEDTYDFAAMPTGQPAAGTTALDDPVGRLTVRAATGGAVASFPSGVPGIAYASLDRVRSDTPFQDLTVYLDVEETAQWLTLDLWNEGSQPGLAGSSVLLQVGSDGVLRFYERLWGTILTTRVGPSLPAGGRLRLRLRKTADIACALHVDAWVGGAWVLDHARFDVADDHSYRGQGVALSSYYGGLRGVRRLSVVREMPPGALVAGRDPLGASDWRVVQRGPAGTASLALAARYRLASPGRLEARVIEAATGNPLPGFDWGAHAWPLDARDGGRFAALLPGVPTGGNYQVRLRLIEGGAPGTVLAEDGWRDVAVGDVWIAAGQSNMSGYSGGLAGAETPIPEAHVFHNDGTWRQAVEPMDDGWEQVDAISREIPSASLMLAFAKELWDRTGVPVGVVPAPLGGTNLYAQWQRNAARPAHRATLYGSMLHRARSACPGTAPRGLLWFQGESDALTPRTRSQYETDLAQLLSHLRSDLQQPELVAICGQLGTYSAANLSTWLPIQEAQRRVMAADARGGLPTAVDLPRADGIHFNVLGYRRLGQRFALAARRLVFGHAVDESADLVTVLRDAAGTQLRLQHESDLSGGAAALFRVTDALGDVGVASFALVDGDVVLTLARALSGAATVSYGWSVDPLAAWLRDPAGVAVPCFHEVAVP